MGNCIKGEIHCCERSQFNFNKGLCGCCYPKKETEEEEEEEEEEEGSEENDLPLTPRVSINETGPWDNTPVSVSRRLHITPGHVNTPRETPIINTRRLTSLVNEDNNNFCLYPLENIELKEFIRNETIFESCICNFGYMYDDLHNRQTRKVVFYSIQGVFPWFSSNIKNDENKDALCRDIYEVIDSSVSLICTLIMKAIREGEQSQVTINLNGKIFLINTYCLGSFNKRKIFGGCLTIQPFHVEFQNIEGFTTISDNSNKKEKIK